jgi:hypothetical protein
VEANIRLCAHDYLVHVMANRIRVAKTRRVAVGWFGGGGDVFSVHQIDAHESSQFEEAVRCFGDIFAEAATAGRR